MQNYKKAMDSIGDWIYIILIAIAVISSFLPGSKKKNKQQNTMPPVVHRPQQQTTQQNTPQQKTVEQPKPQPAKVPSWMDILQSLEEKKPEQPKVKPKPQPQQVQVKSQQKKFKTQIKTEKEAFLPFTEGKTKSSQSSISQKIESQGPIAEAEMEIASIDLDFKDISEIKKGIIYSEIFNRRY